MPVGEDFDYVFDLIADCNLNGVVDADDIAAEPWLDIDDNDVIDSCECLLDINGDGNNDQGDVDCISNAIAGNLAECGLPQGMFLDFTDDGNVDQDDLNAFITAVADGSCTW